MLDGLLLVCLIAGARACSLAFLFGCWLACMYACMLSCVTLCITHKPWWITTHRRARLLVVRASAPPCEAICDLAHPALATFVHMPPQFSMHLIFNTRVGLSALSHQAMALALVPPPPAPAEGAFALAPCVQEMRGQPLKAGCRWGTCWVCAENCQATNSHPTMVVT